jgi:hypothetical protein
MVIYNKLIVVISSNNADVQHLFVLYIICSSYIDERFWDVDSYLLYPKVYYCVKRNLPPHSVLSYFNQVQTVTHCFL